MRLASAASSTGADVRPGALQTALPEKAHRNRSRYVRFPLVLPLVRLLLPITLTCVALTCGQAFSAQQAEGAPLPEPVIFETGWDDLSQFRGDIREVMLDEALSLQGAPVYHLDWLLVDYTELVARQELRAINSSARPWTEIYLHLLPNLLGGELKVERVSVNGKPAEFRLLQEGSLLEVPLEAPLGTSLEPQGAVVLALEYRLLIPEAGGRNYGILGHRDGILSLAHAYPLLAVHRSDGWDLDSPPRFGDLVHARSAFFRVVIEAPASLTIASSGRQLSSSSDGTSQRLEVAAGPVRDFYLVAGEGFQTVQRRSGSVLVRGFAPPGDEEAMSVAVAHSVAALESFERRFGPYPFNELDVGVIPTTALGVEFPGIIVLRRELLSPQEGERWLESTVVHEVAHQWFYSLVGNDQVSEPWLDESLTQYLTLRYFLDRHGVDGYRTFRASLLSRWEEVDRRKVRIGLPVGDYTSREYGAVVYGLGPLVLEWLAGRMTRPGFDDFLRDYVARNAFGLVSSGDFLALAEQHCGCGLSGFFQEWIRPLPGER